MMWQQLISLWRMLRALATDDAYEQYLEHHTATHCGTQPMSRREFYVKEQERKWSSVKRCC